MALFFSETDVADLLPMEDAIDAVEEGFRHLARGGASMVARLAADPPPFPGHYFLKWLMPGTLDALGVMGMKLILGAAPGTGARREARFQVLLFESQNGSLLAYMDGTELTKIRTGAVTAVGTKYLARPDAQTLGIFGSAQYAPMQAVGVCAVRPIKKIKVYSPTPEHRRRFAQELERLLRREVVAVDSSDQAVKGSDIVVTVTNAREPVFRGELLEEGAHVSAAGSSLPDHREVDDQTVLRSKIVVEHREQALKESGDLAIPIARGVITPDAIHAELKDVVGGGRPGRVSDSEITLLKFNGVAIEDIACALAIYRRATREGKGQEFGTRPSQPRRARRAGPPRPVKPRG
ncbi:MAG: ornithine cyclodeaminase family protein [Chloroflexi bacterium]|nr:ornithine cyclodeaminase family protein [Chloroflexota bacterium]